MATKTKAAPKAAKVPAGESRAAAILNAVGSTVADAIAPLATLKQQMTEAVETWTGAGVAFLTAFVPVYAAFLVQVRFSKTERKNELARLRNTVPDAPDSLGVRCSEIARVMGHADARLKAIAADWVAGRYTTSLPAAMAIVKSLQPPKEPKDSADEGGSGEGDATAATRPLTPSQIEAEFLRHNAETRVVILGMLQEAHNRLVTEAAAAEMAAEVDAKLAQQKPKSRKRSK